MNFETDEQQRDFRRRASNCGAGRRRRARRRAGLGYAGDTAPGRKVWAQLADLGVTALLVRKSSTASMP